MHLHMGSLKLIALDLHNTARTIINVVGLFTVSEIYNLTTKQPPW